MNHAHDERVLTEFHYIQTLHTGTAAACEPGTGKALNRDPDSLVTDDCTPWSRVAGFLDSDSFLDAVNTLAM